MPRSVLRHQEVDLVDQLERGFVRVGRVPGRGDEPSMKRMEARLASKIGKDLRAESRC
jgi:hypothetical protein